MWTGLEEAGGKAERAGGNVRTQVGILSPQRNGELRKAHSRVVAGSWATSRGQQLPLTKQKVSIEDCWRTVVPVRETQDGGGRRAELATSQSLLTPSSTPAVLGLQ